MSASRSATITVTWVPNPALQSDPAPTASVNVFASAGAGGPIGSSASADDGFGDQEVSDPGRVPVEEDSTGTHLIPVTNGSATVTVNETASCTGSSASPEVFGAGLNGVSITVDARTVSISTSLGQTNIKPTTAPDSGWFAAVPVADATTGNPVYVDTEAPAPPTLITAPSVSIGYGAGVTGTWGSNSSYLWSFSASGYSTNGTFDPGAIATVTNQYTSPATTGGSQEHAYIHLTDSNDGANATSNLYVRFHNQWEDFQPYTTPYIVENQTFAYPTGVENNGSTPITPSFTATISDTVSLSLGLQGGFSAANLASFGVSYTATDAVSSSGATTAPGPTLQPGFESTPELFCSWNRNIYMVDEYGSSGYMGTIEQLVDVLPVTQNLGWSTPQLF